MNPAAKHAEVLAVASNYFARVGYDRATIADIAAEAGVAVGSVYRLFGDKPSLLMAVHAMVEQRFVGSIARAWADSAGAPLARRMEIMVDRLFTTAANLESILRVLVEQRLHTTTKDSAGSDNLPPVVAAIAAVLQEGMATGVMQVLPINATAYIAHGVIQGAMAGCFMTGQHADETPYRRQAHAALLALVAKRRKVN
jgi:TetR/AcrR family transcriptional regulator, fatty acid metabolism regulator protein